MNKTNLSKLRREHSNVSNVKNTHELQYLPDVDISSVGNVSTQQPPSHPLVLNVYKSGTLINATLFTLITNNNNPTLNKTNKFLTHQINSVLKIL